MKHAKEHIENAMTSLKLAQNIISKCERNNMKKCLKKARKRRKKIEKYFRV